MCNTDAILADPEAIPGVHHYDAISGIHHYACKTDCPVVQQAVDDVCTALSDCVGIRLIIADDDQSSILELWVDSGQGALDPHLSNRSSEGLVLQQLIDTFFAPTRQNVVNIFEKLADLSLLDVTKIYPRRVESIVEQFDLSVSIWDEDDEDDE